MSAEARIYPQKLPMYSFNTEQDFWDWLSVNHGRQIGIWLRFYKKATELPTVEYDRSVDVALYFGWIDGLLSPYDEKVLSHTVHATEAKERLVKGQCR